MPLGRKALKPKINHHADESLAVANVLGCNIHCIGMDEALAIAERFLSERIPRHIVTADASAVVIAQRDEEFRSILNTADLVVPDSNGVVWACRTLGYPVRERVAGIDLMDRLCRLAAERGLSAFFYGAAPGVAEAAAKNLEAAYPGLRVVGTMHGYAPDSEESSIVARIRDSHPD
ncbi:MAG: WecB/TagA/CpsF family glycosyltransferase, partial [Armatimonadota bacterium]